MYLNKKSQTLLWNFTVLCLLQAADSNRVQIKESNVCHGNISTYECTVYGRKDGSTVWTIPVTGCGEITLLHHRFRHENSTFHNYCNGIITEQSVQVVNYSNSTSSNDSVSLYYVSQLMVVVQPDMAGKTVECSYDNGSKVLETTSINLTSRSVSMCNGSQNDTSTSLETESDHTLTPNVTALSIVLPTFILVLFILLLFTLLLLLYGLREKIHPILGCDKERGTSKEQSHHHVINNKADNYIEVVKIVDNKKMGIYNQDLNDNEVQKARNFTSEQGDCNLDNLVYTLQGQVSSKWYSFGLALGVPKEMLNQLKDYSDEECIVEVLDYWLKHHPGKPTWQEIVDARRKASCCN